MFEEEMTVGPKGQVVIPRAMRKALKIHPGSKVVFRLEDNHAVVEKHEADAVAVFYQIARRGRSVRSISPHEYEDELAGRIGA
jgi:AbrB family looped-hinge helix DNA binding protein